MTKLKQIAQKHAAKRTYRGEQIASLRWTEAGVIDALRECVEECANLADDMVLYTSLDVADALRKWAKESR